MTAVRDNPKVSVLEATWRLCRMHFFENTCRPSSIGTLEIFIVLESNIDTINIIGTASNGPLRSCASLAKLKVLRQTTLAAPAP